MADERARRCPFCGIDVSPGGHTGCSGLFREVMSEAPAAHGAPPEVDAARADPARTLHQYVLVEVAGRGGMGEVWKAWDLNLERWVALKFLLGASEADTARFLREARLAARLRHPNIAVVHEVGEAPAGRRFLAMDFVDGETLATARLDLEPALRVFIAVARAVDSAHRAGIIHRDLKPQNILLTRDGWPFVSDFGLAKPMAPGATLSATGAVVGTPAYMPPEQARGLAAEIDERSDVYSLGATFYRVLTGSDPFEAPTPLEVLRLVTEYEPRAPRDRNPRIPATVDTVLRKCLSKSKADRYPTAADVADDLERILSGTRIRGRAPGPLAIAFRRARRSAVSLALSAALVALVAVGAWREWRGRAPAPGAPPAPAAPGRPARNVPEDIVATFVRSLPDLSSLEALALPEETDSRPAAAWCRRARPALIDLREGRADPRELIGLLASAVPLESAFFDALRPLAAEHLALAVSQDVGAAADLPREDREKFRRRLDGLLQAWDGFLRDLPTEFRRRHPELEALDRDLRRRAAEFPAPLPELDAVDLASCLKSADPESGLDRMRKMLIGFESRPGVDLESRRRLETLIILASAYGSLLRGATEDEVVKELADAGTRLRKLGGAADPGDVSPRVRRILAALVR